MFIAALFIIARTWKQPSCPSTGEWIRKLWYIYTMEYYSAIKNNSFESVLMRWMKLEPIIQSEVSQKEILQYSCLENSRDRGAWWAIVSDSFWTQLSTGQIYIHRQIYLALTADNRTRSSVNLEDLYESSLLQKF